MRIFVSGASGYIGSAVAAELAAAGHDVLGLVRSESRGVRGAIHEVRPVIGSIENPDTWADAAAHCQILIHCAAEFSPRGAELDSEAVDAMVDTAKRGGLPRLIVYTSGCWVYGNTGDAAADESAVRTPFAAVAWRPEHEDRVLRADAGAVRVMVLRPGCVYGGSGGLTAMWFGSAAKDGAARVIGDGRGRWTMVHVADLARAYRLAAESPWRAEVFNVSDRSRFTTLECATAASRAAGAGGAVETVPVENALKEMGPFAEALAADQHVDSSKAARLLGWQPRHGGFVDGVERYQLAWKTAAERGGAG